MNRMRFTTMTGLALLLLWLTAGAPAPARAATEPTAAPAAGAPADAAAPVMAARQMTFGQTLKAGGWTMWPLGLCSLLGVGLVIYNAIVVRPGRMLRPAIVEQVRGALEQLDIEQARALCVANPAPVCNIIYAGLERIRGETIHSSSIEKGMEESSLQEIAAYLQPINYLSTIGMIAPMLGLLGTVSGMIKAFGAMAFGAMGRPELLADNISEALITTAAGLIIGIPIMVAYYFFKNRFSGIVAAINRSCGNLLETLTVAGEEKEPAG